LEKLLIFYLPTNRQNRQIVE